jgi:hypothetical protein
MNDPELLKERRIAEAAARALAEAEARRRVQPVHDRPTELGGRDGPEPTRFGDWEKDGILSDF